MLFQDESDRPQDDEGPSTKKVKLLVCEYLLSIFQHHIVSVYMYIAVYYHGNGGPSKSTQHGTLGLADPLPYQYRIVYVENMQTRLVIRCLKQLILHN